MSRRWLAPLGAVYGGLGALRAGLYRRGVLASTRARGPVVSVGNLSVGGSGKTPLVARIAELGMGAGLPVAVLSRGYRGRFRGEALVVSDGERRLADAALAGDEPAMLAHRLPGAVVAVGRRRDRVARVVEERFGPRLHVLDDGFQHLRLRRDLDLLCLDPADLEDRPLPAGRLRETPAAAARAHAFFVTGDADLAALRERWPLLGERPAFRLEQRVTGFTDLAGRPRDAPQRPWLLSGIARPARFATLVRRAVAPPLGLSAFPDHHPFRGEELARVGRQAVEAGADAVLTTAKDAVRLFALPPAPPFCVVETEAAVDDESWLRERLVELGRARLGQATS